jgi:adhesin/invasin
MELKLASNIRLLVLGLVISNTALLQPAQSAEKDPPLTSKESSVGVSYPLLDKGIKPFEVSHEQAQSNKAVTGAANLNCDLLNAPRSVACVGGYESAKPTNGVERAVMGAASLFATDHDQMISDPKTWAQNKATYWGLAAANTTINSALKKIPFFAQTTLGFNYTTNAAPSFYLDSFLKLAKLGVDSDGDPTGIVFGQVRYSAPTTSGSTLNLGLGARHRVGKEVMVGLNTFWDYRFTSDTSPFSRIGIGEELFWKDFELRNNWYISPQGSKPVAGLTDTFDRVIPGVDVELGYRLPAYPQLAFYLKGFSWDYYASTNNYGIGGSANWQATPYLNLEATLSNEVPAYLNGTQGPNGEVFFGLKVRLTAQPIVFAKRNYKKILLTAMTQPVRRTYEVKLERYTKSSGGWTALVTTL